MSAVVVFLQVLQCGSTSVDLKNLNVLRLFLLDQLSSIRLQTQMELKAGHVSSKISLPSHLYKMHEKFTLIFLMLLDFNSSTL